MIRLDFFGTWVLRTIVLASVLGPTSAVAITLPAPTATATPFADAVCPTAVPDVQKYEAMIANQDTPVDDAIATAKATFDLYQSCASAKLSNHLVEQSHYATLRAAQFLVAAGHWQRLIEANDAARTAFQTAMTMLGPIIDWDRGNQPSGLSNNNTPTNVNEHSDPGTLHSGVGSAPSLFHDQAVKVRDFAAAELALLPKPGTPPSASSQSGSSSPLPARSPGH
jgi:hypothetical protein